MTRSAIALTALFLFAIPASAQDAITNCSY